MSKENTNTSRTVNLLWSTQLMIFALVASLWFDRMGEFQAGLKIAMFIMVAGLAVLFAPEIGTLWRKMKAVVS